MTNFVPFIPIYLAILAVSGLVAYFYWKSLKIAEDAEESLSILEIMQNEAEIMRKSILKSVEKSIDVDKIAVSVIESVIDLVSEPENQEPLKEALQGLMSVGGLGEIGSEEILADVGENLVDTIYSSFGIAGQKILESSLGENWEEKVKLNPRKAMSILQGYANFGVFDLLATLQNKFQDAIPNFKSNSQPQLRSKSNSQTW